MNRASKFVACALLAFESALMPLPGRAQSADWQSVVWRGPQVRYLLADMTLGGNTRLYRDYAVTERDPDSREAYRTGEAAHEMGCQEAVVRFDAGVKIINLDQFERKKVDGKTLITHKGSNERISGMLVKLSTD